MRRLIVLALLAVMPASMASAQPPPRYPNRPPEHVYERDRYDDGYYDRDGRRRDRWSMRRQWRPIIEGSSATSERQFIDVLGRGGRFSRLLIESVRGAPVIERVAVEFADHQTQVWDLNRRLPRGADELIDLGGRKRIHRIVVYTNPAYRGAYSIYGG